MKVKRLPRMQKKAWHDRWTWKPFWLGFGIGVWLSTKDEVPDTKQLLWKLTGKYLNIYNISKESKGEIKNSIGITIFK
jgi:hypothetical protein